jgi:hypothetical protein
MRTLRLCLAGVAVAVLVSALSTAAIAQDADMEPSAVYFSGSSGTPEITVGPEVTTTPDGVTQVRGVTGVQTNTFDDTRFSGTETWVHNEDHYGDVTGPVWGTSRVENDDGSWAGMYQGVILPDGSATYVGTYVGEGGHEGLSVICASTSDGVSGFKGDCVLFPGSVPPPPPAE